MEYVIWFALGFVGALLLLLTMKVKSISCDVLSLLLICGAGSILGPFTLMFTAMFVLADWLVKLDIWNKKVF